MLRYALKRLLWLIPIIIFVSFIVYGLLDLAPGTVVDSMITESMTEEDVQELIRQYDLDKPMIYRYGKYMWNLLHGDLGVSQISGISVWEAFSSRFPNTLLLALAGLVIGVALSIPLGMFAAKHSGSIWDTLTTGFSLIGLSMPGFWLGILLLLAFSYGLKLFPASYDGTLAGFILPAISTGLVISGTSIRQTRSAMLEEQRQDYLRTARAKGVPEKQVNRKHALRNAWIPIITAVGTTLSRSLAGSVIVETVFSWPGVGRLTVEAVSQRDVTLACGCVILTSITYVVVLLLVDLLYAMVDPRIKAKYVKPKKKKRGAA